MLAPGGEFFGTIESWVHQYIKPFNVQTDFHLRLNHFESNLLLSLLKLLESAPNGVVYWYFDKDDEDMREAVDYLASIISLEFRLKQL